MDIKLITELIIIMLIGFRIYTLEKFGVRSAADKLFALYYLKNHYPLIGYTVIFYIFEIIIIEMAALKIVDITLIIIAMIELFMIYRHLFITLRTDDRDDYIDTVIKRMFTSMTYSEYQQIKGELYKPLPKWKLYLTEMLVFFFAIWAIEFQ
jgi:signal transduction histidine kinase